MNKQMKKKFINEIDRNEQMVEEAWACLKSSAEHPPEDPVVDLFSLLAKTGNGPCVVELFSPPRVSLIICDMGGSGKAYDIKNGHGFRKNDVMKEGPE